MARFLEGSHGLTSDAARDAGHHLPRRAADDAALRAVSRARVSALSDPAQDRARRRERSSSPSTRSRTGRVVYASNHRSHIDYLVEPLVLDDAGIRPPIIAAGINLFGGPLGLIHKHVTGALPIRRNTKDPGLPDHAEGLRRRAAAQARSVLLSGRRPQLQRRAEAGEDRAVQRVPRCAACRACKLLPIAVAYDLVLEDHVLARQKVKRSQRPFSREIAEMVRFAVGYRSRAFVTFGKPISLDGIDPRIEKAVLDLTRHVRARDRPALQGAADGAAGRGDDAVDRRAPSCIGRIDAMLDTLRAVGANLSVHSGGRGAGRGDRAARAPATSSSSRAAATACASATCCATTRGRSQHLLSPPRAPTALMLDATSKALFHALAQVSDSAAAGVEVRDGARRRLRAPVHRRRDRRRSGRRRRAICRGKGLLLTLDYLGESVASAAAAAAAAADYVADHRRHRRVGHRAQHLAQADAARPRRRSRHRRRQHAPHPRAGRRERLLRAHRHGELAVHRRDAPDSRDAVAAGPSQHRRGDPVVPEAIAEATSAG